MATCPQCDPTGCRGLCIKCYREALAASPAKKSSSENEKRLGVVTEARRGAFVSFGTKAAQITDDICGLLNLSLSGSFFSHSSNQ